MAADGATEVTVDALAALELPYFARHGCPADPHICARDAPHDGAPHECACGHYWTITA